MTHISPNHAVEWNDNEVALLKAEWKRGTSLSLIAKMIPGATRNSVAGKIHRLKLPKRTTKKTLPCGPGPKAPAVIKRRAA